MAAVGGRRRITAGASAVSATLLRTCEFVDNRHTPDPEQVLWDIADTISRTGSLIFRDTSAGVVFCPEHAQLLASGGMTKADVQAWLIEHCGRTGADLRRQARTACAASPASPTPTKSADDTFTRILPSPRHVPVIVAGARNAAISMVARIFGEWSGTATPVNRYPPPRSRSEHE